MNSRDIDVSPARPKVSVLLPVYNAQSYVRSAIESILAQSFVDFELIVVDDASTDASVSEIGSFSDPRLKFITLEKNSGQVGALNIAIREASGLYLARMDADDIALEFRLELQTAFLDAHSDVAAVGSFTEVIDSGGKHIGSSVYPVSDQGIRSALEHGCPMAHPSVMMRRDVCMAVGQYRSIFRCAEDLDLWLRISERGKLANIPIALLKYRNHAESLSASSAYDVRLLSLVAQRSADFRRVGAADPVDGKSSVSEELLDKLGISAMERKQVFLQAVLDQAKRFISMGEPDRALTALNEAQVSPEDANIIFGEMAIIHFRIRTLKRRYLLAGVCLVSDALRQPQTAGVLLRKAIRLLKRRLLGRRFR